MKDEKKEFNIWDNAFTIPNIMSALRIGLIPVIVWAYIVRGDRALAAALLALSGVTDIADGYIARRFNMVSDLGKILDPVADKFTQAAMLLCLLLKFRRMLPLFVLLAVKEISLGIFGVYVVRRTGAVKSANWHGKLATMLLYLTVGLHILFPQISASFSSAMIVLTGTVMLMSFMLYLIRNIEQLKNWSGAETDAVPERNRA